MNFKFNHNAFNIFIIGNGFDLHLDYDTSFVDYFETSLLDSDNNFKVDCHNLLLFLIYLRFYGSTNNEETLFRRVYNDNPNWMDVESFIKKIATDSNLILKIYKTFHYVNSNIIPSSLDIFQREILLFLERRGIPSKHDLSTLHSILSKDLIDFEESFRQYLNKIVDDKALYEEKASNLLTQIMSCQQQLINYPRPIIIDFNYTLIGNNLFALNVHGTKEEKIVIGYDSTDGKIENDHIFGLSKDWQKADIDISPLNLYPSVINTIFFYGHSLGEQDYPYFFNIFDKCHILESKFNIRIVFCYSVFEDEEKSEKRVNTYKMNATKLLNAYERFNKPETTRNMIVNKLKTEGRLFFVEVKD